MNGMRIEGLEGRQLMAANVLGELNLTTGQDPVAIGLLLPAVQKVREAAARTSAIEMENVLISSYQVGGHASQGAIDEVFSGNDGEALLLPAVQKVREAAGR